MDALAKKSQAQYYRHRGAAKPVLVGGPSLALDSAGGIRDKQIQTMPLRQAKVGMKAILTLQPMPRTSPGDMPTQGSPMSRWSNASRPRIRQVLALVR